MTMTTSEEREVIASRMRGEADNYRKTIEKYYPWITGRVDLGDVDSYFQDIMHFCGIDGKTDAPTILDRLADLIDPTCHNKYRNHDDRSFLCSKCGYEAFTYDDSDCDPDDFAFCPNCGARVTGRGETGND